MTRPDCFAYFLDDPLAHAVKEYVIALETELAACQAREAYLREVLEAQPRREEWTHVEGVERYVPDYATRLRDQALAGHQP